MQDSAVHPDTGDLVFRGFRFSAFVPVNVPLVIGMLSSSGPMGTIFWQWANQSYNVAVNYANRNIGKDEMTTQDIAISYAAAVASSCSIALGLGRVVDNLNKRPNPVRHHTTHHITPHDSTPPFPNVAPDTDS